MELLGPLPSLLAELQRTLTSLSSAIESHIPSVQTPLQQPSVQSSFPQLPRPLFTDMVRQSILSQPKPSISRPRASNLNRASSKLQSLRQIAMSGKEVCYKCGDTGHLANVCRNALTCFSCGRTGHRSTTCHHQLFPPPPLAPLPQPLAPSPAPPPLAHVAQPLAPRPAPPPLALVAPPRLLLAPIAPPPLPLAP